MSCRPIFEESVIEAPSQPFTSRDPWYTQDNYYRLDLTTFETASTGEFDVLLEHHTLLAPTHFTRHNTHYSHQHSSLDSTGEGCKKNFPINMGVTMLPPGFGC